MRQSNRCGEGLRMVVVSTMLLAAGGVPAQERQGVGSGSESTRATQQVFSFKRLIQPILDAQCVSCHLSGASQGGLNLEDGYAYQSLVRQQSRQNKWRRIEPGNPDESYLVRKLEGSHIEIGGEGTRMPPEGSLDNASLAAIRKWILTAR